MNQLEELLKKIQDEFETIFKNLKSLLIKKNNTTSIDESDEEIEKNDDLDDETKKKNVLKDVDVNALKKKAPMLILSGVLLYLVADVFLFNKEEKVIPPVQETVSKKNKKIKEVKLVEKVDEVPKAMVEVEKPKKIEEVTPVSENNDQSAVELEDTAPEDKLEIKKDDVTEIPPETAVTVASPRAVGEMSDEDDQKEDKDATIEDQMLSAVDTAVSEENEVVIDYISPPRYHRFGRGLVYNCKEKHWACVDQYSFLKCRENEKWNEQNNKQEECKTRNVYATSSDCIKVQTYYTNNSESTDFCERKK